MLLLKHMLMSLPVKTKVDVPAKTTIVIGFSSLVQAQQLCLHSTIAGSPDPVQGT